MIDLTPRLRAVFVEALALDSDVNVEHLAFRDVPAWDSVGHMTLVAAIEDEFDVQLDTDQVIDLASFAVARDMVAGLLAGSPVGH
jgi:acyl carrier protein